MPSKVNSENDEKDASETAKKLGLNRPSLFRYANKYGIKFKSRHNTLEGENKKCAINNIAINASLPISQRLTNEELARQLNISTTQLKKLKPKNSFVLKYSNTDWQQALARLNFKASDLPEVKTSLSAEVFCHCGRLFKTRVDSVLRNNVKSCGCLVSEPQLFLFKKLELFSAQINVSGLLPGKSEIDIYLPQSRLAIEYCGLHWHRANALKDNNYHRAKFLHLQKQGIQLLTIFEDEWLRDKDLVCSMILNRIGVTLPF
jgi:AraC-like DNA-binding protein